MTLSAVNVGNLFIWKELVLKEVRRVFSDPEMHRIQQETGVWKFGGIIPYPKTSDISVIKNGCLSFTVQIALEDVLFSIWMLPGEVRAGIKLPNTFFGTKSNQEVISRMLNGQPCQRTSPMGTHTFFDWILTNEEFAAFDFMLASIEDDMKASVLAERITQLLTHLYLATLSTLIELMKLKIVDGRILLDGQDVWKGIVTGDMATFKYFLERSSGVLINHAEEVKENRKHHACTFQFPVDKRNLIKANIGGNMHDQDNGRCMLVSATSDSIQ